ncbi:MAG: nickel pincer cofactor biosynthesis protein LarC [Negativicutes bacterium]|nr:nickel pincer cofactor biosynthesis protein LarC [Negativicutes bacterium]
MRAVYLDCFSGVSGNMLLGALIDVGVPEQALRDALTALPVSGYEVAISRVEKCGISAAYVDVKVAKRQHHRHLPDIIKIIDRASLKPAVKEKAKQVFQKLAEAEAKVHGTTVEKVHFHEVGAVDAIVDVVGTVFGFDYLGVEQIFVSKLNVGGGFVRCSHGLMSVPAPATVELLKGIPYASGEIKKELVTPTGAALVATLAAGFGAMPEAFRDERIGYGAGTWDLDIPNVLRMHLGVMAKENGPTGTLLVEANIDDFNPQNYEYVMNKLFQAGALDVWLTPIIMKKGRPGIQLSALIPGDGECLQRIGGIIIRETTTLGVRSYPAQRLVAERKFVQIELPWGKINVKFGKYAGEVCNIAPEYEDCRMLAEQHGIPLKAVQQAAMAEALKLLG